MICIDFHSHILPCMDDGSRSIEETVAMLRMEAEQGVSCVIATPHFYPRYDTPGNFLEKRAVAMAQVREAVEQGDHIPQVILGAEVYFFPGMSESDQLSLLTLEGGKSILIEMPPPPWTEDMYRELEAIRTRRGIIPIIAHLDRYISPIHTYGIPKRLAQLPVLVQTNAEFFLHWRTAGMAMRMLKAGQIHLLGSDCHNVSTRKPNLGEALQRIRCKLGEAPLMRMEQYQRNALDG